MTLQKTTDNSSDSNEDDFFHHEPLTQLSPKEPSPSTEDQQSPAVESPKKNSKKEKTVQGNSTFTIEELSSDDEIFTFQCPEKFNTQDLCDKNINFTEHKPTITSNNEVYQLEFINSRKNSISLALPKKKGGSSLVNLPLKGHVVIKRVVDLPAGEPEDPNSVGSNGVVFPTNIKIRHPLLGTDWKAHIDQVKEVIKKNKLTTKKDKKEKVLEKEKKTKKLKSKNSDPEIVVKKKKKKHVL